MALQDLRYSAAIERGQHAGLDHGRRRPRAPSARWFWRLMGLEGRNRQPIIDVEAVRLFQKALLVVPRRPHAGCVAGRPPGDAVEGGCAARLPLRCLPMPSSSSATLESQQAMLEYGAEIQTAPRPTRCRRAAGAGAAQGRCCCGLRLPRSKFLHRRPWDNMPGID